MVQKRGFFDKENAVLIAQLLRTIEDLLEKLEKYHRKKDIEKFEATKKEILGLQGRIKELL